MKLIDTHTHLFLNQFDEDRNLIVEKAVKEGVTKMFLPNVDEKTLQSVKNLHNLFPENCLPLIGLHPSSVKADYEKVLDNFEDEISITKFYGIGETGIDLYWDKSTLKIQIEAFKRQIEWAKKYQLPIIIHARESFDEIFKILDKENDEKLFGIFHCFTGNISQVEKILSYKGFKLGIGGVVTYKNSGLENVLKNIDLQNIVLETDSPYLTPLPYRGKRNESSYLILIANKLAEIYNSEIEKIAEITTQNAEKIFKI